MVGDPIRLGSAIAGLVPDASSNITTDDYGVQRGTITYQLGNQLNAQGSRFALGASYSGSLNQFFGFVVNRSGDIRGAVGGAATIDVEYARIDPLWVNVPKKSHDLQLVNISAANLGSGYGDLYTTLVQMIVPIPHPVITYRFASASFPSNLGTYGTPTQAPSVPDFVFAVQSHDFANAGLDIEQKTITLVGTLITINPDGTCTRTTFNNSVTVTGIFSVNQLNLINMLNLRFTADPLGWLCLKEEVTYTGAGAFFLIEQQWKRNYIFAGTSPGTWWQGGRRLQC